MRLGRRLVWYGAASMRYFHTFHQEAKAEVTPFDTPDDQINWTWRLSDGTEGVAPTFPEAVEAA